MLIYKKVNSLLDRKFGLRISKTSSTKSAKKQSKIPKLVASGRRDINKFDLVPYLEDLKSLFESSVASLDFINTAINPKPLTIELNGEIRSIRLQIPTMNPLHLHSIKITDENGKRIATPEDVTVHLSGQDERFGKLSDDEQIDRLFSTSGKHKYAFYTSKIKSSWVVIHFKDPIYIKDLVVNNVPGHIDPRWHAPQCALGLIVSVSDNLKDWKQVFDLGGVNNFEHKAIKIAYKHKLNSYVHGDEIFMFTKAVLRSQKKKTVELNRVLPAEYKPVLFKQINELILNARDMEWTSHGMKRSFRYWTRLEKQEYIRSAMKIMDELKELSPDVTFGFGSVLAAIRDKDMLPHDDDMDTLIAFKKSQVKTYVQAMNLVEEFLAKRGYYVIEKKFNVCKTQIGTHKVDVFVGIYEDDGTIGWYPNKRHILKRSDIFPTKNIKILGEDYSVPKNADKYLEYVYTKDWKHPDPGFKYYRDRSMYSDIAK